MKGATPFIPMIGPRAETGRTQSGTLLRNEVKQMRGALLRNEVKQMRGALLRNEVKQMRGATGLTVLALILACVATLRCYLRAYK